MWMTCCCVNSCEIWDGEGKTQEYASSLNRVIVRVGICRLEFKKNPPIITPLTKMSPAECIQDAVSLAAFIHWGESILKKKIYCVSTSLVARQNLEKFLTYKHFCAIPTFHWHLQLVFCQVQQNSSRSSYKGKHKYWIWQRSKVMKCTTV